MVSIFIAVLAWIPAILGLGSLVPYSGDPALRRAVCGLLGLGVLSVLATGVHFFAPVGPSVSAGLWLAGTGLLLARWRWVLEGASWSELAGALLGAAFFARWMPSPAVQYDSGLYYLQAVLWTTEHPLQLGLANLHDRLGFNSAWHLVAAALELPLLGGRSASFANLLPMVLVAGAAGVGLRRVASGEARSGDVALALAWPVLAQSVGGLGAASPDQPVALALYLALVLWIRGLEADDDGFAAEARPAVLLSVFAVLIKLSAAPVLWAAVVAIAWRRGAVTRRWLATTAALSAAAVVPWCLRSILLSGCVVYPAPWTCLRLPWSLTRAEVQTEVDWVTSWARTPLAAPREVLGSWSWLPGWAGRMAQRSDLALFGATAALGIGLWAAAARRAVAAFVVPFSAAWLGVLYVFLTAPDPRFGYGFLHAVGLVPLALGLSGSRALARPWARALVAIAIVGVSVRWARISAVQGPWRADWIAFPQQPTARTEERLTGSGLGVRVPIADDRCWATPVPCSPYFKETLRATGRMYTVER
jgi:hypothetical protein